MPEQRPIFLVAEPLEIGEPLQLSGLEPEPIAQGCDGLDARHIPRTGRRNGLHPLRLGQPLIDRQLVKVFRPGASETVIVEEESNYIAVVGPRASGDCPEIPPHQWAKPAPLSAKRPAGARCNLFGRGFAAEKRTGENAQQRWVSHDRQGRNAPTSPTLREPFCVQRSEAHATKSQVSRFPGVTPERPNQRPSLEHSAAEGNRSSSIREQHRSEERRVGKECRSRWSP